MPFDALPIGRAVHVTAGSLAQVDLYVRNSVNAALLQAAVEDWDFRVYEEQGASPETLIYSELAKAKDAENASEAVDILHTAVQTDGQCRIPQGRTMLHKFDPVVLFNAAAGRVFALEYTFRLLTSEVPFVVRVALVVDAAYQ